MRIIYEGENGLLPEGSCRSLMDHLRDTKGISEIHTSSTHQHRHRDSEGRVWISAVFPAFDIHELRELCDEFGIKYTRKDDLKKLYVKLISN